MTVRSCVGVLGFCLLSAWSGNAAADDLKVAFSLSFDDAALTAECDGKKTAPVRAEKITREAGFAGQAVRVDAGSELVYDLSGFPQQSGTMEFMLSPAFPQKVTEKAGTILALSNAKGEMFRISYVPPYRGFFMGFVKGGKEKGIQTHYGRLKPDTWNHIVLTWTTPEGAKPTLVLHPDGWGKGRNPTMGFTQPSDRLTTLCFGGKDARPVRFDEFVLYDRALSTTQVEYLRKLRREGRWTLSAIRDRARQDAEKAEARERFVKRFFAEKKIGVLTWLNGQKVRGGGDLFGVVPLVRLRPETMKPEDLEPLDVLYAPAGGGDDYTKEQWAAIVDFVRRGGGYVGVCKGAFCAARKKILDFKAHGFGEEGITPVDLMEHPITEGYDTTQVIHMHHGNGPLMVPGPGVTIVGRFRIGPKEANHSAILAGVMPGGKGRVVVFSPHPTGGSVGLKSSGKMIPVSWRELHTDRLLINAFLWAGWAEELARPDGAAP